MLGRCCTPAIFLFFLFPFIVGLHICDLPVQGLLQVEGPAGRDVGEGQGGDEEGEKQKWRVGDLLVDERCSPAVLDFLRSTHAGRTAPSVEENWDSEEEAE